MEPEEVLAEKKKGKKARSGLKELLKRKEKKKRKKANIQ